MQPGPNGQQLGRSGVARRGMAAGAGLDDYAAYTSGTGGSITRSWPMADPLGSVAALTNDAGVATQINRYDEYGVPQAGFSGRFGYAGAMYLNRGMAAPWNMRNRQYHPTLGRFLQTDPIGIAGGINLYAYVGNDPVNMIDPWGLQDCVKRGPKGECVEVDLDDLHYRFSRCRAGWFCILGSDLTAFGLGFEWLTGTGPEYRYFGASSGATQDLMTAPDIERLRCTINERAAENDGRGSFTNARALFGLDDYATANTWIEQFTGSYNYEARASGGTTRFIVTNRSSITSVLGGTFLPSFAQPPSYARGPGMRPMSSTYQTYKWSEPTGVPCAY
jgi:RHS repeat-associated protein